MSVVEQVGQVVALWRYPVKSMQGEELNSCQVTERGLHGDRVFALMDAAEGRVVSAKNPRKWPGLFDFRAALTQPSANGVPTAQITLPDGRMLSSEQPDRDALLSRALGRPVTLSASAPASPVLEEYWPDIDGLPHRDAVTDEAIPAGTFFDLAPLHILTTATLDRLRELSGDGRFEARRFRPNIVIACAGKGFVEQAWIGTTFSLGDDVRLQITGPCPRCVMTTLAQSDLPADSGILRTAVKHNQGHVGVYAKVIKAGVVRRGDRLVAG